MQKPDLKKQGVYPIMENKEKQRFLDFLFRVKNTKNFSCSNVAYAADLLEAYCHEKITYQELRARYDRETIEAQYVFSHMSERDIQNSQRIFEKEFAFADALSRIFDNLEEAEMQKTVCKCMEDYLSEKKR